MKKVYSAAAAALFLAQGGIQAAVVGPYTANANTLHLWHLDETATPAADQAHYNYNGTFTVKPDANQPLNALFGGAALGAASHPLFGTALNSTGNPTANLGGLSALTPANGTTDNADHTFDHPTQHSFTMEAIVKIGFDPNANITTPMEIIAGEGDAGDSSDRSWQFRLEPKGFNPGSGARTAPVLRFQKVSGFGGVGGSTASYNLDGAIPLTGANAIAQDEWYHVAVTYNGNLTDPSSLQLYWTKLDPNNIVANQIATGNMNGWLRQQDTDFAIGNELRDFNGNTEGFRGLIDEVRISDTALANNQMQFIPEPGTAVIAGVAGVFAMRRRRVTNG